jgi:hypothetical protein
MVDDSKRCTARSRRTGERCKRPVTPGYKVCRYHGANPKNHGGCPPEKAKGNLNALIHGVYAERVLDETEQKVYDGFIARIRGDFEFNDSSDEVAVHMAAIAFLQFVRAQNAGKQDAANTQAKIVRDSLKDLKATKITREGEGKELNTTPAQWAAELLREIRTADGDTKAGKSKPSQDAADRKSDSPNQLKDGADGD